MFRTRRKKSRRKAKWGRRSKSIRRRRNAGRKSRRIRVKGYLRKRPRRRRNPFFGLFKKRRKSVKRRSRAKGRRRSFRRRRNPNIMRTARQAFAPARIIRGGGIVFGLGIGAAAKQMVLKAAPTNVWLSRLYGAMSILAGALINMNARQPVLKAVGTGMVSYGILDLAVTNIEPLANFLPQIAGPTFALPGGAAETTQGGMAYGRQLAANLPADGNVQVVDYMGANLTAGVDPEIVAAYDEDVEDGINNYL